MQPPNIHIIVVGNPPSVRIVVCWVHTKCHSAEVRIVTQPPPPSLPVTRTSNINHNSDKHLEERIILVVVRSAARWWDHNYTHVQNTQMGTPNDCPLRPGYPPCPALHPFNICNRQQIRSGDKNYLDSFHGAARFLQTY